MIRISNFLSVNYSKYRRAVASPLPNKRTNTSPLHIIIASLTITKRIMLFAIYLLLLLSYVFASPLYAYQLNGKKWPQPTTTFYVDIPGADGLWNDSFETAMYYWGVDTVFQYRIVRGVYEDPCDGYEDRNGVSFESTVCGDAWGSTTLAVNKSLFFDSTLVQADIIFNSNESWDVYSTSWWSGQWYGVSDFQRVAIHELGHALGLGHEDSGVPAIMRSYAGDITTPQQDDKNGVGAIYGFPIVASPATITVPAFDPDGNYTVSWESSSTGSATYVLQEASDLNFSNDLRTAYSGISTSTSISGRRSGSTYYYRVKATRSGYTDSFWVTGSNGCLVEGVDDDNDGMADDWEVENGLDPTTDDSRGDLDGDGANNLLEYYRNTDPNDANSKPITAMPWLPLLLED